MQPFPLPALADNYIWLIIDEHAGHFDCVDPGDAEPVLKFASSKNLKLRNILLTHHHFDHIGGVSDLINSFPLCKVYGPADPRIANIDTALKKGDTLSLEPYAYQILANPGHTSTHISYYEPREAWLFCGDTLFSAGCGRVFDSTMEELHASMQLFKNLPKTTKVFCAHEYTRQNLRFAAIVEPDNSIIHEYIAKLGAESSACSLPSTIDLELSINPFLRTDIASVKAYAIKHGAQNATSLEVFRCLRNQKNLFQ